MMSQLLEFISPLALQLGVLLLGTVPLLLAFLYYKFCYAPFQVLKRNGFIGPTPSFFFGNYKDRAKAGGGIEHTEALYKEYGSIVGHYIGQRANVFVSDLELIKLITVKDFDHFMDRPTHPDTIDKKYRPIGLLFGKGESWRTARRILSPTFSSFKMKAMTPVIKSCVDTLVDVFQQRADSDKSFDILKTFGHFTLEAIIATSFGRQIDIQKGQSDKLAEAVATAFSSARDGSVNSIALLNVITSNLPWLEALLPYLFKGHVRHKAVQCIHETVTALIQERRNESDTGKHKDLLQLMMEAREDDSLEAKDSKKLTDEDIVSHSMVFLLAGYETTSNALSYTSYLLALNPHVQERLQEEIDTYFEENPEATLYKASQDLEYLDMVIQESLRLYSPAPIFPRLCVKDYTYKGMTFRKGFRVLFNTTVLHMDPQYWKDPEKFDPLRFSAEEKAQRPQMCYMPFGAGPRSCIGMRLALLETKIVLIELLKRFTFVKALDTEVPLRTIMSFTRAPVNGIYLKVKSRN